MTAIIPSVPVRDISECVEFYRNILGFELVQFSGRGADAWAVVRFGAAKVVFRSNAATLPERDVRETPLSQRLVLHVVVPDAARLYQRVAGRARVLRDYEMSLFGGGEFVIEDPCGLILTIQQGGEGRPRAGSAPLQLGAAALDAGPLETASGSRTSA